MGYREMGGEFWLGPPEGDTSLVPVDGMTPRYTLSGRTALEQIALDLIKELGRLKLYMPSYCCHTMLEPFNKSGSEIVFYTVKYDGDGLKREYDFDNGCNAVLLMNYFGFVTEETAEIAKVERERGKKVIVDITHSAFCKNEDLRRYADYICASVRKWFFTVSGIAYKRGAFVIPKLNETNTKYVAMRKQAAAMKLAYMDGKRDDGEAVQKSFEMAEAVLEQEYAGYSADDESVKRLGNIDIERIRAAHRTNAATLYHGLTTFPKDAIRSVYAAMRQGDCPMCVPVWIGKNQRDALRSYLLDNGIRCSAHWQLSELHSKAEADREIYAHELSLVCDERYSREDMQAFLSMIKRFFETHPNGGN